MNVQPLIQFLFRIGISIFLVSLSAQAEEIGESEPADVEKVAPKKLNLKDLEKKYWTPKDTNFKVVQNRTYAKEKRFAFTLAGSLLLNDSYNEGSGFSAALNYYLNENHGLELNYIKPSLEDSEVITHFRRDLSSPVAPNYSRMTEYIGFNYNFVPFYAKVSLLDWKIIYFDFAISPGVGLAVHETQSQNNRHNESHEAIAFSLDFSQHFFFSKHFAIRIDVKNSWYKEKVIDWGSTVKKELPDRNIQSTFFNLGFQFFF